VRPYAIRKSKDYVVARPGDLIQIDTLDLRPLPGVVLKQFTAVDMAVRWIGLGLGTTATAQAAKAFLLALRLRLPFPIRAVQVDGGSEFKEAVEDACRDLQVLLCVLPPRNPKRNGCVERTNGSCREEFWEC